ncbi:MAG: prepilin peptidase [SAR324 cluster bacterium]|nr:prepilin peptidase [SAR324 cluster bacterium]
MIVQDIFIVILGLVFGSFLFSMVLRLHHEDSVWHRSACDYCSATIGIIGLIPLLGFIIHKGKCRNCGSEISRIYPLTEILNAALVYTIYLKTGWHLNFFHGFLIFESLLLIAFLDFRTHLIFPQPVLFAFLFQCVWLALVQSADVLSALIGLFMGAGVFHWISYLYQNIRKRVGLGEGDATLLGLIGFAFGWNVLFATIFWGAVFGILCGGTLLLMRRQSWTDEIPFGPWLVMATFLIWYFPDFFQSIPFKTSYQLMLQF